ncbi:Z1 domain-containing protein [Seleniivibrio sp.]|uniref:Z1 domain-containing protein n=1 Tax=Seleniivibrio sp. TaxID=2898801 RepID=UPI0025CD7860|nr:Z1 domain-containing protein [Seleniivibrio sp.]MCD8554489.1 Z1 domain-containing protein [Seleniivibrio sp.]
MNFVVGGCVLRHVNNNTHYSYVIHTATQKTSHISLENVTREFFSQIKNLINSNMSKIDEMLQYSYEDIKKSYSEYNFNMPSFEDIKKSFIHAITKDYISVTTVNSDKDIDTILDEDSGELKLRSPFSVFVGGQVLDRGVTIPRMIGFYYGRNPKTMQQDTVMQHSRMFGYRSEELLSVTRFYTTRHIFENMTRITEIDKALRDDIENKTFGDGIYFIRKHIGSRVNELGEQVKNNIVPCSPLKIALSSTVIIKSHSRILPIGFNTIAKSYASKISKEIKKLLEKLGGDRKSEEIEISPDAIEIVIDKVFSMIEGDDESSRFITKEHFMSTIQYLAKESGKLILYTRRNGTLSKYKNNGIVYQDAPDTGYELQKLRAIAVNNPVLMLIHQDGSADGWNGSEFWWPVLIAQKNVQTTMFALSETSGKLV